MKSGPVPIPAAMELTEHAFRLRETGKYAAHPVQAALQYHCAEAQESCGTGLGGFDFESAENLHRAGAQGLRLSEIPDLPRNHAELSRISALDRASRSKMRRWVEAHGPIFDHSAFDAAWESQGRRGGAEHHVHHDENLGRWFKRLYRNLHYTTLGEYFSRMRLHAAIFPETAYRLEGFAIHPRNREMFPVVSQPHVEIDMERSPVSREETDDFMAAIGFAPLDLLHDGAADGGYFAYLHPVTGVLVFDLHDENVVRLAGTNALVVIDPFICLARRGTWAAIKLQEIGLEIPPDNQLSTL